MKAWTYALAPSIGPYWKSHGVPVILIDHPDGRSEWREVANGSLVSTVNNGEIRDWHRGKLLPPSDYPKWLYDIDDYGTDEGL